MVERARQVRPLASAGAAGAPTAPAGPKDAAAPGLGALAAAGDLFAPQADTADNV